MMNLIGNERNREQKRKEAKAFQLRVWFTGSALLLVFLIGVWVGRIN